MTFSEKNQMKKLKETQERIEATQKKIDQKLQSLKIDELKNRLDEAENSINSRYSKRQTDDQNAEFQQMLETHTQQITKLTDDLEHYKEKMDTKHETLAERVREKGQTLAAQQEEIERINGNIKRKRQHQAENDGVRKHLEVQVNKDSKMEETENRNSKLVSKLDEEVDHLDDDLQKIQKSVNDLLKRVKQLETNKP